MSGAADTTPGAVPEFKQVMGHPRPLWMLFMTEFWERFAFYGMRWALALYIVAQFFGGDSSGEASASKLYGAYLALVYAAALFGGYVADKVLGYQRSILLGAVVMAAGLFMITVPSETVFKMGLATVIAGNGLFKPNISTMVGQLYSTGDERRDSGFTLFYMGINAGALIAPVLTGFLAENMFGGSSEMPAYKAVFIASGIGMLISLVWFWIGRAQLQGIGRPVEGGEGLGRVLMVAVGVLVAIPAIYFLLTIDANNLQILLTALFVVLCVLILREGFANGAVARDKAIAMLIIFAFNVLFWMFFEQAGSSFNFLAQNIVERDFGGWTFPVGWFQSVNSLAIITLAPVVAWIWIRMGRANPSIPRKFGLGIIFNGLAFLLLMIALSSMVDPQTMKIPFWTLFMVYVIQSVGELCLSPIGLSMVTKLAPMRLVGFGMGGWFLSTAIGNNLSGIFASSVSGEAGMTVASAQAGYTFGFWVLIGAGVLLFLIAPLIQKLMHGVK
ncbi:MULTISPECIES: peptide MFS transporter [Thermomonas]|jgi:POT family proton-dependent oligopeptide transporter|uniref:MFS transporter n=1 Tax=Thermomonas fusca TaxID=215690 RepID=A0A5R9PIX4_9GAMM|nr:MULTISPECIES: oligopeptide:H+ symporter [Thermomonas]MBH2011109.1 MFS transporter [Xanthomonadaceae bacterium]TLX22550.1 MFS transporter [Thermomonas fusca]